MKDMYKSFAALSASESEYRIIYEEKNGSEYIVLGPHGGRIEPGVSELVRAFSDQCSIYLFEGVKQRNNRSLHLTSTCFDEPLAVEKVNAHHYALAIHGYHDPKTPHTLVGGADRQKAKLICERLNEAGFSAKLINEKDRLAGVHPKNIVNRTKREKGLQLEISTAQRKALFSNFGCRDQSYTQNDLFDRYVDAVKLGFLNQ
ncbi:MULTISPECIES: poly-gamma-glutamate hydrolase family protein [unclassified Bacillus (in: firmicutes)]|uniref:poly-gamma-glutamate hydrolase family protein n=1 Tax=unclassified Bacillus (in: firmicutes) TaxID=185979 RepID=UPI00227F257F|nr:poly-gamma-glutamate hydrolase family protein [Bacillus sp. S20C3]MCY8202362.1 poly-gamma-glutamate hydrolase family protein [Bacillus sp. N12A5]MCY8288079.1 poly-gamma-glutamate hydrolase family protein [Bacillus sp. N13C7]MCY8636871.1 poly-gamma-glutamate hydrolase family protein [Bacillus sp. S17B2]MCY8720119.1 poly-gamma-glutamate hydrolase family protein [Bacillus sp. S10C12M]MCY9143160.1 poly-gamma-glutamate hydrolase family protein [Bacillus sp. T9C1]